MLERFDVRMIEVAEGFSIKGELLYIEPES